MLAEKLLMNAFLKVFPDNIVGVFLYSVNMVDYIDCCSGVINFVFVFVYR